MSIILSDHQNRAFEKIISHDFQEPFYLGGCAGTGKTTLLVAIAEYYGNKAIFLSPTGKACQVLTYKMPKSTLIKTAHSALYAVREITDEELEELRQEANSGDEKASLKLKYLEEAKKKLGIEFIDNPDKELFDRIVVVDESSMLAYREFLSLQKIGAKIVLVGDPFQLQPVSSRSVLPNLANEFHAFLTEVHRAAMESPITRLATEIRSGEPFRGWEYWKSQGIGFSYGLNRDRYKAADQVITGMNATRRNLNRYLRDEKETHLPIPGDKVIIKQNVKKIGKFVNICLVNGDIGITQNQGRNIVLNLNGKNTDRFFADDSLFCETYDVEKSATSGQGVKVDYAYAITAHASQGSEWDDIVIFDDEMRKEDKKSRLHWMYTAITRAKEKLTIVKKRK